MDPTINSASCVVLKLDLWSINSIQIVFKIQFLRHKNTLNFHYKNQLINSVSVKNLLFILRTIRNICGKISKILILN
jgi:hypothetical protein